MKCVYCGGEMEVVAYVQSSLNMEFKSVVKVLRCKRCFATRPCNVKEVFYVHAPGRSAPKVGHDSLEKALAEAERVAKLNGTAVRVYKQVAVIRPTCCTETHYGV